jgi:hypothetical protein
MWSIIWTKYIIFSMNLKKQFLLIYETGESIMLNDLMIRKYQHR